MSCLPTIPLSIFIFVCHILDVESLQNQNSRTRIVTSRNFPRSRAPWCRSGERERERERRRVDLRARPRPHCPPPPLQRNVAHLGATFPRPLAREVVGLLDCLCPPHGGCSVPAGRRHREPSAARRRGQRGTGHGGAVCPSGFVLRPPQSGDGNDALVQFNATGGAGLGSDVRPETR